MKKLFLFIKENGDLSDFILRFVLVVVWLFVFVAFTIKYFLM